MNGVNRLLINGINGSVRECSYAVSWRKRKVKLECGECENSVTNFSRRSVGEARDEAINELNGLCRQNHCIRLCTVFRFTCTHCYASWDGCVCLGMAMLNTLCRGNNCSRI